MSSTEPGAGARLPPASPFLFSEIPLAGTLEELERVYRRREESAGPGERLDEAYAVARTCLEAVLDEAHVPRSSLVAPESSGARSSGVSAARNAKEPPESSVPESSVPESSAPESLSGSA